MNLPFAVTPFQVSVLLIVAIYATTFRVIFGGKRFGLSVVVGGAAFLIGQVLADRLESQSPILFGDIRLVEASVLCWVAMVGTYKTAK